MSSMRIPSTVRMPHTPGKVPSPPGDTPPRAPPREPSWAEVRSVLAGLYVTGVTEMYRESFCVVEHLRRGLMPPLCDCDAKAGPVLPLHKETHGVPHLEAGLPPDMLAKIDQMTRVDKLAHELAGSLLVSKVRDIEHVTGRRERVICDKH